MNAAVLTAAIAGLAVLVGWLCFAVGRLVERRKVNKVLTFCGDAVSIAANRLTEQAVVETELLDIVNRQRQLLRVLVDAVENQPQVPHPSMRNVTNSHIIDWVARRARQSLL